MAMIINNLYLGNYMQAMNYRFLIDKKINLIVNCSIDVPNYFYKSFGYINLNGVDTQSMLNTIIDIIIISLYAGFPVFVHCFDGVSRSAIFVIYTLMKMFGWAYVDSYNYTIYMVNKALRH